MVTDCAPHLRQWCVLEWGEWPPVAPSPPQSSVWPYSPSGGGTDVCRGVSRNRKASQLRARPHAAGLVVIVFAALVLTKSLSFLARRHLQNVHRKSHQGDGLFTASLRGKGRSLHCTRRRCEGELRAPIPLGIPEYIGSASTTWHLVRAESYLGSTTTYEASREDCAQSRGGTAPKTWGT